MDDIEQMREYVSLVELRSFTAVARRHYLSQSTVSKRLKRMEDDLGVTLIERGPKSVSPTEEGMIAYEAFRDIIARYDVLQSSLSALNRERRGELSIGVLYHGIEELTTPFVRAFNKVCPNVSVRYVPCQNYQVIEKLDAGEIDVGVTGVALEGEGVKYAAADRFVYTPVCPQHERCAFSPRSPLAGLDLVRTCDLRSLTFVCMSDEGVTPELVRELFGFTSTVDARQIDMVPMMLAENPHAFALIDAMTAERFGSSVVALPFETPMLGLTYCYACRKDNNNSLVPLFLKSVTDQR